MATRIRTVDVFLRYLKAEKVDCVFGIVGGLLYPLFDAVELDPSMTLIMTKHEQGAAFMADGYARVGRRLGVCAGTSGPGATNLMTGVACAFADGVPLLVITGQAATHALGKGAAQEMAREDIDIVAMFRPVTKYSAMVTHAQAMPHHVRRALRAALTGRPGPVHLNVPVDLWEQELPATDWFRPESYRPETHTFDRHAVQRTSELLLAAKNPVFLVGSGVAIANAETHVLELASLVGARVATTPKAKGVFPEDHPLSLGVLGNAGHREARELVLGDTIDVLFTVGASLSETSTFNWSPRLAPSQALVQLDIDADRIGRNYPVDVSLVGDAQTILVELLYHVHRGIREGGEPAAQWDRWAPLTRGHARYDSPEQRTSAQRPLTPQRWRVELQASLPSNAVVFSDIGGHMLFNIHDLCIGQGQRFIINMGFGSMGHGLLAPIGAAMSGYPGTMVAIAGDGCFTMHGLDLLTAVDHSTKVIWIIENNNMHGITWHCSRLLSGRPLEAARARSSIEVASIARAMGVQAHVVDAPDQLRPAFESALRHSGPSVIEVRVDPEVPPPLGERAKSLAGFIK